MHVAFVLPRFYPYRGGYENSLLALARHLVRRGHRATVLTTVADDLESFWLPGFKTFPQEDISVEGVVVRRFPISYNAWSRRATRLLGLLPYWRWKTQYWRPSFPVPGLGQALAASNADLFHIGPLPYNSLMYAGLHAGEIRGAPVVATPCSHLGEPGSKAVAQHYVQPHQIALLRHCRKVFCMTQTEWTQLERRGVPAEKLVIAPFAFDSAITTGGDPNFLRANFRVDGPVVLHLGMKAYEKGSETLVEAMKLLWAKGSKAWLVMAGPSLSTFDTFMASSARNCSRLLNLPPFPDQQKRDFLASATVVAQPSRVESLGLVLLEAWANCKPVIAADIGVSRELIDSSGGGVVVPFGEVQQLAGAIDTMLSEPASREAMGTAGHSKAVEHAGETLWQRTTEEMERVAAEYGRRSSK